MTATSVNRLTANYTNVQALVLTDITNSANLHVIAHMFLTSLVVELLWFQQIIY